MVAKKIKIELLGSTYNFCNLDYILGEIFSPDLNKQITLSHQNLHGLALALKDQEFNNSLACSDFSWIDGLPIVWMLKIAGYNISQSWRLTFLDWYQVFFDTANAKKSSIFLWLRSDLFSRANVLARIGKLSWSLYHCGLCLIGSDLSS